MVVVLLATACVPGRPTRTIEAEVVGLVGRTDSPTGQTPTVEFEDGRVVEVPRNARAFAGSGYTPGDLLLLGEHRGQTWYARLTSKEQAAFEPCYEIDGVAYDDLDSVIMLSDTWRGVGLRLPKRADFVLGEVLVDEDGLYRAGGEYPEAAFCVDVDGFVMGLR